MSSPKNISLRQIQAFLAVAELGSFTRAAERLSMSQPALSLLVRQLERDLKLKLFDRTSRRTDLTSGGHEFERAMRRVMEDFNAAVLDASALASRKRGRVVLAAPPTFSAVLLPRAISEFSKKFPGISVLLRDTTQDIAELIREGQADVGLGTFSPNEPGIDRTVLVRDTLMVICRRDSKLARGREIRWAELEGEPFISLTAESGVRHLVDASFQRAGSEAKSAFEVSSMATAIAFVEADLGITILPTYAMSLLRTDAVLAKPLTDPRVTREICVISHRERSLPPAAVDFINILRKWARLLVPQPHP